MTAECEWGIELAEQTAPAFYTVAVYKCDRAYGGHEEGGWWFDTGERCDEFTPQIFKVDTDAYNAAAALQAELDRTVNADGRNRDLNSVCCVGRYEAEVHAGYPPAYYPEHRPHWS